MASKGRRETPAPPAQNGTGQTEPERQVVHTLTLVLSMDVATGRMTLQPVGVSMPVETVLALLDRARTEIVRAQIAAEAQQHAAPNGVATNG